MWLVHGICKSIKTAVVAGAAALFAVGVAVPGIASADTSEASVFDLFDRAVLAIVANARCGAEEQGEYRRFTSDFPRVYDAVEDELLGMNPDKSRDDLQIVIGFRTSFLEQRAVSTVKKSGCESSEVRNLTELFDLDQRLAAVERGTYSH